MTRSVEVMALISSGSKCIHLPFTPLPSTSIELAKEEPKLTGVFTVRLRVMSVPLMICEIS